MSMAFFRPEMVVSAGMVRSLSPWVRMEPFFSLPDVARWQGAFDMINNHLLERD